MSVLTKHNVQISGQGNQPIVFLHGFGCDQSMWRLVAPAFEENYKVIKYDLMGAGGSDLNFYEKAKYSSLKGHAEDLLQICDELKLKDVIFVGHSVSAMIGVLAAIQNERFFSELVLVGPSPCYINDGRYKGGFERADIEAMLESASKDYFSWARAMAPAIMGNPNRPELGVELTNSFCKTDAEIAKHFARVVFLSDNRDDLPKLRVPSLILQCSQDIVANESVGKYLQRNLRGSTFKQLDATGHCPHVSHPEETVETIMSYLIDRKSTRFKAG